MAHVRLARWVPVAAAVLLLAGCGQTHRQSLGRTLYLTAKDNGKEFTVRPHEAIVVTLAFDRIPGYHWEFTAASQARLGFRQLSQRYVAPKNRAAGATGKEIWRYRPVGRGGANLGVFYGKVNPEHTRWLTARSFDVSIVTG